MGKILDFFKKTWEENKAYYAQVERPEHMVEKDISLTSSGEPIIEPCSDNHIIYYFHGHVVRILPEPQGRYYDNRDIIYGATTIISDGMCYDLTNKKSIYSIAIPSYHIHAPSRIDEELGVTGYLEYTLRMRAGRYWNEKNFDLAIACLGKATQLMKYSSNRWAKKEFYRIVDWLIQLGRFDKADEWKDWINNNIPNDEDTAFKYTLDSCNLLETDLVLVEDSSVCCEKCAMYRKRVYSLSGKDKRFPKFPSDFHMDCGLKPYAFVFGVHKPMFSCDNFIKYSNRPFVDDRTDKEIATRAEWLEMLEGEKRRKERADTSKIIYYQLKAMLPDDLPKSLSAFSRMRNANTPKYQDIVKKAEEAGFKFPKTDISIDGL